MKRKFSAFLAAAIVLSSVAAFAITEDKKAGMDKFESICSGCHSTALPKSQRHTLNEWKVVVARMRSNGCDMTDAEADTIAEYLGRNFGK